MANIKASINPQKKIQVTQYRVNAQSLKLGDLVDVDTTGSSEGGLLVYNDSTETFNVTSELDNNKTKINGGHF